MGASGWHHVVPFAGSVEASFAAVRQRVLDAGDFLWHYDRDGFVDDEADSIRPKSLAELDEFKENEEFWDEGSHSILDTDRVVPAETDDEVGAIRPLSDQELQLCFGTSEPKQADFDRAYRDRASPLHTTNELRWSGRCAVLYLDSVPHEVAFWGFSGD